MNTRQGSKHQLAEFTVDDLESMVRQGPGLRGEKAPAPESAAPEPASSQPAE